MDITKKTKKLLEHYYSEGTSIKLKNKNNRNVWLTGKITKFWKFWNPYIIIGPTKIFVEDIDLNFILPETVKPIESNYSDRTSTISKTKRYEVMARDNNSCCLCGVGSEGKLEVDHIKPLSKGGSDDMDNLQTLCFNCNRGKRDKE